MSKQLAIASSFSVFALAALSLLVPDMEPASPHTLYGIAQTGTTIEIAAPVLRVPSLTERPF